LAAQLKADLIAGDACAPLAESIVTTWLKLSKDGPLAVRVDGRGCLAGVTNWSILLYSRDNNTWRKVLDAGGYRLSLLPTRRHGWRDLEVVQHVNVFISTHLIYRFDGNVYKAVACESVDGTLGGPLRPKRRKCSFDHVLAQSVQTEPRQ